MTHERGIERPETVESLIHLVAQIIFRCTAYHASINYTSFHCFSYPPNMPAASFGPGPTGTSADTEASLAAMLPNFAMSIEALHLFYEIYPIRLNRLGYYPDDHFTDERVAKLMTRYHQELDAAETVIGERDKSRLLPYPYLLPSRVTNSIHV